MKGISPMIAVVLLIAFTVAVGSILSLWFSSLTTTQTAGTKSRAEALTKCANAALTILSADSTNNKLIVTHYGTGLTFYPLSIQFSDGTVNTTFQTSDSSLTAGETATINVTFPSGATWAKVVGSCQYGTANITIEATCRSTEDCWS